jgi:hypothetical protein
MVLITYGSVLRASDEYIRSLFRLSSLLFHYHRMPQPQKGLRDESITWASWWTEKEVAVVRVRSDPR